MKSGRSRSLSRALSAALGALAFGATPLAAQHAAPQLSLGPHHGGVIDSNAGAATLGYATPAYISRDVPRSVSLVYNSNQARATGFVQVDATHTTEAPTKMSIQVYGSSGAALTSEIFYQGGLGTSRLAANWTEATSAYLHRVVVKSYWSDGTTTSAEVNARVIVVGQTNSHFGTGWSIPGLQRVIAVSDGALILNGDGTAAFFSQSCPTCAYVAPDGEFTTLVHNPSGTWTRTNPDGTYATYTGTGFISAYADRAGRTQMTYTWGASPDGFTVPFAITDPIGAKYTFSYLPSGYLGTISDPRGRVTTLTYTGTDLTKITGPDTRAAFQATYDASHRLSTYKNTAGVQFDVAYDNTGQLASITAPAVATSDVGTVRPVSATKSLWAAVLPGSGLGTSAAPGARVDPAAIRVTATDPRGNVVKAAVDRYGAPIRVEEPYGRVTTMDRNQHGQVTRTITFTGDTILFTWNGVELTRVVDVLTHDTLSAEYESTYHQPTYIRHGLQRDSAYYDAAGAVQRTVSLGGGTRQVQKYSYLFDGRIYSVTDPANHGSFYSYEDTTGGKFDNLRSVQVGVSGYSTNRTTTYARDAFGRDTMTISPNGDKVRTGYDLLNRVTRQTDPLGNSTVLVIDSLGLAQVIDAKNQVYSYTRNALGWVTSATDPRNASIVYQYDRAGNATGITNRRSQTVTLAYDSLSRVISRNVSGATTTWTYGSSGLWAAVSNSESTDTVKFDAAGRLLTTKIIRGSRTYVLQNTNDSEGRRTQLSITGPWTGAYTTGYRYNDRSQVDSIVDFANTWTEMVYDGEGMWSGPTLPMNWATFAVTRSYVSTHVPSEISYPPVVADLLNTGYNLNANGLVGGRTQRFTDEYGALGTQVRHYGYDRLGQLTSSDIVNYFDADGTSTCSNNNDPNIGKCLPTASGIVAETYFYNWDATGNPTGAQYTVEDGNRLTRSSPFSLEYDADGNLTRKYRTDATPYDQRLYWNAMGQLDSVTTNGTTTRYGYDGFGQRIRAGTKQFIYDGDDLLMELNSSGTPDRMYTYYPGVDNPHSVRTASGSIYYYASDFPGNVVALINKNRQIVAQYTYSDFGQSTVLFDSIGGQPLQFAGREMDSATGLVYMRNRWYDPFLGRFISEDPIGLAGGVNPFVYAGNSPATATDPFGLCVKKEGASTADRKRVESGADSWCSDKAVSLEPIVATAKPRSPAVPPLTPTALGGGAAADLGRRGSSSGGSTGTPKGFVVLSFVANDDDRGKFQGCRTATVEHYEDEGMFIGTWLMNRTETEAVYPRLRKFQFQRWVWYTGKVITREWGIAGAYGYVWCETGDAQFQSVPIPLP